MPPGAPQESHRSIGPLVAFDSDVVKPWPIFLASELHETVGVRLLAAEIRSGEMRLRFDATAVDLVRWRHERTVLLGHVIERQIRRTQSWDPAVRQMVARNREGACTVRDQLSRCRRFLAMAHRPPSDTSAPRAAPPIVTPTAAS